MFAERGRHGLLAKQRGRGPALGDEVEQRAAAVRGLASPTAMITARSPGAVGARTPAPRALLAGRGCAFARCRPWIAFRPSSSARLAAQGREAASASAAIAAARPVLRFIIASSAAARRGPGAFGSKTIRRSGALFASHAASRTAAMARFSVAASVAASAASSVRCVQSPRVLGQRQAAFAESLRKVVGDIELLRERGVF